MIQQSQPGTSKKAQNPESKSGSESVAPQDVDGFTTPIPTIPLEVCCSSAANFLMDLFSHFNNSKRIIFENSNFSPLWELTGELFGDIQIGKKIGSLMVQCHYALEDFSDADFEDFTEYLQDFSLGEDTTH